VPRHRPREAVQDLEVDALTEQGHGLAYREGVPLSIAGALPGERVQAAVRPGAPSARLLRVLRASAQRVEAPCAHFGRCTGCSLQHLDPVVQLEIKQARLLRCLRDAGLPDPVRLLEPLRGPTLGYRRKARLSVRYLPKQDRVVVGFRDRNAHQVADVSRCEVLHPRVGGRLEALADCLSGLGARARIPQIEIAVAEEAPVLVLRVLDPLGAEDEARLTDFAKAEGFWIVLQGGGPQTLRALWPPRQTLHYPHPEPGLSLRFEPLDFLQVNAEVNAGMLRQALTLLEVVAGTRVLELFCGLGNFSLALAAQGARVEAVEGDAGMVERARAQAAASGLADLRYHLADLSRTPTGAGWSRADYDAVLLDPPRAGAPALLPLLRELAVPRILYVSCNPKTLAADLAGLCDGGDYGLEAVGIIDMFPHTGHVESMALLQRR
jgi:23S rRNA (uracil1939-C5)-methyltransferase